MKTLLVAVSVALAGVSTSQAQIFRPSVGGSAAVGAIAGSLIGGHNGDLWAEGAIIGGVAGALIGAAVAPQAPAYASAPPVYQYQSPVTDVYGQQVYGSPTVGNAPLAPMAPTVGAYYPTQVVQAPPQVAYSQAPQVVYVPAAPRVVYAPPPVVSFGYGYGYGYGYGPRSYAPSYRAPIYYGPSYRGGYSHGHRR